MTDTELELLDKLNRETAKIAWVDLQRFFAAGKVIYVAPALDLVETAVALCKDDADYLKTLMEQQKIQPVTDQQAQQFVEQETTLWALVLSPWVLVQPITPKSA